MPPSRHSTDGGEMHDTPPRTRWSDPLAGPAPSRFRSGSRSRGGRDGGPVHPTQGAGPRRTVDTRPPTPAPFPLFRTPRATSLATPRDGDPGRPRPHPTRSEPWTRERPPVRPDGSRKRGTHASNRMLMTLYCRKQSSDGRSGRRRRRARLGISNPYSAISRRSPRADYDRMPVIDRDRCGRHTLPILTPRYHLSRPPRPPRNDAGILEGSAAVYTRSHSSTGRYTTYETHIKRYYINTEPR